MFVLSYELTNKEYQQFLIQSYVIPIPQVLSYELTNKEYQHEAIRQFKYDAEWCFHMNLQIRNINCIPDN